MLVKPINVLLVEHHDPLLLIAEDNEGD